MMAHASLISELALASLMNWSSMLLRRSLRLSSGATNLPLIQMCCAFRIADADSISQIVDFGEGDIITAEQLSEQLRPVDTENNFKNNFR
jgi:hypothetical protein